MRKIIVSGIAAITLSLSMASSAWAQGLGEGEALTAAQTMMSDITDVADILKTGKMNESPEGRRSFEKLNTDVIAIGQEAFAAAGAQNPLGTRTFNYTQEDLYILAHVICGEAQSYPDEEQLYVGSVVLNRVNHPSFPNSLRDVVFQKGQYACTRDGNYNREPTPSNWANAKYLLDNGSILPGNVVWQSGGRQGSGVYIRTRYHCYCY